MQAWRTLRRLWPYAALHLSTLRAAFACMAVLGLTTGAYALLMGPSLRFLLTGGEGGFSQAASWLAPLASADRAQVLWALPALILVIAVFKGLAYLGQFSFMALFGQRVGASLRIALLKRLGELSPLQLSRQLSGDLLSRAFADVSAVEVAANYALGAYLRDGLQIVILFVTALVLDWRIALLSLVVVPLAAWPAARLTRSFLGRSRVAMTSLGHLAGQVQEGLGGLRTLQAFEARQVELARFDANARRLLSAAVHAGWARAAVPGIMEVLGAGALALALVAGAGAVPPERLVSLLAALVLAYQPVKELGRVGQMVLQASLAAERICEVLALAATTDDAAGARPLAPLRRGIRFEDVCFAYPDRVALSGLTLDVPYGKVTALVGPSGGGKSTVLSLLLRLARPSRGRVLFDGVDLESVTAASLRAQLAWVTQEPALLSGTVRENLVLGRPSATEEELVRAARKASAHGFIRALPGGYDAHVGERGTSLSGGQRQRLCLARALLADAPVLLLDEATSGLDAEGEREVQAALAGVLPGRTAVVVAHRLATIRNADLIHVIEAGAVVESGAHDALLARGGAYARLWALQHGGGSPEGRLAVGGIQ